MKFLVITDCIRNVLPRLDKRQIEKNDIEFVLCLGDVTIRTLKMLWNSFTIRSRSM